MLRIICAVLSLLLVICLAGCFSEYVVNSIGLYESCSVFSDCGIQDTVEYSKYFYVTADIESVDRFKPISDPDARQIELLLDYFEEIIVDCKSISEGYDFDRALVSGENYYYLVQKGDNMFENFKLYIFSPSENILYFFHSNI